MVWGQTHSRSEIDAKLAELKADSNLTNDESCILFPQLIKDIKTEKDRYQADAKRAAKRNDYWSARKARQANETGIPFADESEALLAQSVGSPLDQDEQMRQAEDAALTLRRKANADEWEQIKKDQNERRIEHRENRRARFNRKYNYNNFKQPHRDFWEQRKENNDREDATYSLKEQMSDFITEEFTFFDRISRGCNIGIYRPLHFTANHVKQFVQTIGFGIRYATAWLAMHARECFETVCRTIYRAGKRVGRFFSECKEDIKIKFDRATSGFFFKLGNGIIRGAIAVKRQIEDLNPVAAYRRSKAEARLFDPNVGSQIQCYRELMKQYNQYGLFPKHTQPAEPQNVNKVSTLNRGNV